MGDLCPAPPGNRPPLGGPVHRTAPHHDAMPKLWILQEPTQFTFTLQEIE